MSGRWRLMGWLAIAAGLAVSAFPERPAILVGSQAGLVLIRGAEGRFEGKINIRDDYEVSQWLARDGDSRRPRDVRPGPTLDCHDERCVGTVGGKTVIIGPAQKIQPRDCEVADLLITSGRRPRGCPRTTRVVDRKAVDRKGTHAIYIGPAGEMRIETVEQSRGIRPWTMAHHRLVFRRSKSRRSRQNAADSSRQIRSPGDPAVHPRP